VSAYQNSLQHTPFFTDTMFPGMFGYIRGQLLPGYVMSVMSPTTFDVVIPIANMLGRLRITLANVDKYNGQFKQALSHVKGRLGFEPHNDRLRWVSIKVMTEERMPDVIGTLVTFEGVDVGRELVELKLMERYDPSRNVQPIP
jgi:hypothetical protein